MVPERPAIRLLDVQQHEGPPGRGIVLVDRLGISEPAYIPEGLLPIVGRCNGALSLEQIRNEAQAQYGEDLPIERVREVVRQLDERLLLLGARHDAAVGEAARAFLAHDARPSSHAGSPGYPADAEALRAELTRLLSRNEGEGALATGRHLRGLIAPHIDLPRGADGYAAAYGQLQRHGPADLYVVFGTGHAGPTAPVTGLGLDWETPLGTARTDRAFVEAIAARCGEPDPSDLLIHRSEHSLEFQVLFLQHLHQSRFADHPFRVACFLCGSLPSTDGDPLGEPWMQELLGAFRAAEAATKGRVCYVAGADLAHVGPLFGDPTKVDDARLERLADDERTRLALLERGLPGPFHAAVAQDGNPDHVCSGPAITLCAALAGGQGQLLHYGQARANDDTQTVSFCAMAFEG